MHSTIIQFLSHLKTARNSSNHTIRGYEVDLGQFHRYLVQTVGELADPTALDSRRLRAYSAWLSGQSYAPSTVARRLACLRSFYRYLRRNGIMTTDPVGGLRNPKQPKRLPKFMTVDGVIRLLDSIPVADLAGIRDRAILETLYGGGLRVSELVGINLDDVDLESGLIRVLGKRRRERLCPVRADRPGMGGPIPGCPPRRGGRRARPVPQSARYPVDLEKRRTSPRGASTPRRA